MIKCVHYKNKLTSVIRLAEKQFYFNKFEQARGNINKTWQIINSVIAGPNHNNINPIAETKTDVIIVTYSQIIASKCNSFISNIGPNLAHTKVLCVNGDISENLKGNYSNSMFVTGTDPQEIITITTLLKSSTSK